MRLDQVLGELFRRQAETERRFDGLVRQGTVHSVDAKNGTVRVRIGGTDDDPVLSPSIPYSQTAGALKVHSPPSIGQQMTVLSGSGDFRQGLAVPMTWSDKNGTPSDKGDENVITYGNFRAELRGDELLITIGGFSISMKESGATFTVGGVTHAITATGVSTLGGKVEHDGKNIGSDHVHGGVFPGGADTDVPSN